MCRAEGVLAIHFVYDGASTLFFKVFDAEGRRLECCPRWGHQAGATAGAGSAARVARGSSGSSGDTWEPSDSPELYETPETSDDSYVPLRSRRARSRAATSGCRR